MLTDFQNFFLLLNSPRNLQQTDCHTAHHTINVLLHYPTLPCEMTVVTNSQSRTGCKFLTGQVVQERAAPLCRKDFFLSLL